MEPIEIAHRLAELGQKQKAQKAYRVALANQELTPLQKFEAASYLFFTRGDEHTAYSVFVQLYKEGYFQQELWKILQEAFYQPNESSMRKRYQRNCAALEKYPYFFHKEFPAFEELPLRFYPFDQDGYLPYDPKTQTIGEYINFKRPVVDRYFFRDLEKPVFAQDVYSQYQLEYLTDSLRKSEWVARDNHVYLHFTNAMTFFAYLQCLDLRPVLSEKKAVILLEGEETLYPIDFKEQFGIDYSQYSVRPFSVTEVNRLIWHTQLSSHNGGDFFNEIFYGHPNLLSYESLMMDTITEQMKKLREQALHGTVENERIRQKLIGVKHPTLKDCLVAYFLSNPDINSGLDPSSRLSPIVFFQPHFTNIRYQFRMDTGLRRCSLFSLQYEEIRKSPLLNGFRYIKTFTPIRRLTTSYAATTKFMIPQLGNKENPIYIDDELANRLLNRSYLCDPQDRLFQDSALVRFEDGKLNPEATFTKLAEFLDIPYTESMTYCSSRLGRDPESYQGNVRGFDPASVYRTYDEYTNDEERAFLEYFFKDLYEYCGYDFQYYKGEPIDEAWLEHMVDHFTTLDDYIDDSERFCLQVAREQGKIQGDNDESEIRRHREGRRENRLNIAHVLLNSPQFVSKAGQPLRLIPLIHPDPDKLAQPLYH